MIKKMKILTIATLAIALISFIYSVFTVSTVSAATTPATTAEIDVIMTQYNTAKTAVSDLTRINAPIYSQFILF